MTATSLYYDRPYELVRTAFSHLEDRVDTTLNVALTTMRRSPTFQRCLKACCRQRHRLNLTA